jgi:dienelactone hydrolase
MPDMDSRSSRRAWLETSLAATAMAGSGCPLFADETSPDDRRRDDVPWLGDVTRTPKQVPAGAPQPASLAVDESGNRISSFAAWQSLRLALRKFWLDFLGLNPGIPRTLPKTELLDTESLDDGIVRQRIRYAPHPGWPVEAYVLIPRASDTKAPAAVVFHPTVDNSIDEPSGLATKDGPADGPRALGLHLARKGFVTICPRNFLWPDNDRIDAKEEARRWLEEQPPIDGKRNIKGMGKMLYDAQVAIDLLAAMESVDAKRIAVVGHSLGAKEALYAAAFDDRVTGAGASEGGLGIRFSNWHDPWYLGASIQENGFQHDHHELLALAAPRPFLNIAGESADGDRGWPLIERAREIYALADDTPRLGQFNHRQGHPLNEEASKKMVEWMVAYA